ncbi:hypothetical protein, partial [Streptomyces sviceus]|uniref:hypothetical protein n=1 Tax=Streptomyces sviceus TaxID=285530 RepID=UPI0036E3E262
SGGSAASAVPGNGRRPLRADTPHPVPFPPYAATAPPWRAVAAGKVANGPSWREGGERPVVARKVTKGPFWRRVTAPT